VHSSVGDDSYDLQFLETTELFANIHADVASTGQTSVPTDLNTDLHFTCFVQAPDPAARAQELPAHAVVKTSPEGTSTGMRLIELDGRRSGPVDRGECPDFLKVGHNLGTSFDC
jgi:ubiquitin carboxyl-terminal hydrolase L3